MLIVLVLDIIFLGDDMEQNKNIRKRAAKLRGGKYYAPFSLRVSEDLLDKISQIAEIHKRSINKEIEYVLEEYIKEIDQIDNV